MLEPEAPAEDISWERSEDAENVYVTVQFLPALPDSRHLNVDVNFGYIMVQRRAYDLFGNFTMANVLKVPMPSLVVPEAAVATYENGILDITLPKQK